MTGPSSGASIGAGFVPFSYRCADGLVLRGHRRTGTGPALQFLSGNGFCAGVYGALLRRLPAHWQIIALDLPGQGYSDDPPRYEGSRALLARIEAAFDELFGGASRIAMGHSFGGVLSALLAARQPDRIAGLLLLDPVIFPPWLFRALRLAAPLGLHPFEKAARRRRAHWPSRAAAREYLRGRGIYRGWTEEALDDFVRHALRDDPGGGVRLACPPGLEAEIFARPAGGYWQALARYAGPVAMIHGRDSYPFLPAAARRLRALQPDALVRAVPGGHCFMQQHPDEAAQAVAEAVTRLHAQPDSRHAA